VTKIHVPIFDYQLACICLLTITLTVPQDYDDLLSYYTRSGYRVIAIAAKSIEGLSWLKAQRMKRSVRSLSP
jgi:hypothetical protein